MLHWQERTKELHVVGKSVKSFTLEGDLLLTTKMKDALYFGSSTSTPNIYSMDILIHVDTVINRQIH